MMCNFLEVYFIKLIMSKYVLFAQKENVFRCECFDSDTSLQPESYDISLAVMASCVGKK